MKTLVKHPNVTYGHIFTQSIILQRGHSLNKMTKKKDKQTNNSANRAGSENGSLLNGTNKVIAGKTKISEITDIEESSNLTEDKTKRTEKSEKEEKDSIDKTKKNTEEKDKVNEHKNTDDKTNLETCESPNKHDTDIEHEEDFKGFHHYISITTVWILSLITRLYNIQEPTHIWYVNLPV